jgi:Ca2+-binding EF-hand superfamily protein
MKSLRLTVLFIVVMALIEMPILAQQARGLVDRFKQLDRNEDGKLTRQELKMPRIFSQMDKDGDGSVTLEEARGFVAGGAVRRQGGWRSGISPCAEGFPGLVQQA